MYNVSSQIIDDIMMEMSRENNGDSLETKADQTKDTGRRPQNAPPRQSLDLSEETTEQDKCDVKVNSEAVDELAKKRAEHLILLNLCNMLGYDARTMPARSCQRSRCPEKCQEGEEIKTTEDVHKVGELDVRNTKSDEKLADVTVQPSMYKSEAQNKSSRRVYRVPGGFLILRHNKTNHKDDKEENEKVGNYTSHGQMTEGKKSDDKAETAIKSDTAVNCENGLSESSGREDDVQGDVNMLISKIEDDEVKHIEEVNTYDEKTASDIVTHEDESHSAKYGPGIYDDEANNCQENTTTSLTEMDRDVNVDDCHQGSEDSTGGDITEQRDKWVVVTKDKNKNDPEENVEHDTHSVSVVDEIEAAISNVGEPIYFRHVFNLNGFNPEDISVNVNERRLVVTAERKEDTTEGDSLCEVRHSLILPADVIIEQISSTFTSAGLLHISAPRNHSPHSVSYIKINK